MPRSGAEGGVNDTAFAIFALSGVQEPAVQTAVRDAADWLLSVQNADGGWEFTTGDARSSADITGAVIQALRYAGRAGTQAEQRALAFLRTMQQGDGGFQYSEAVAGSNTASTAWAVQGLWAAGIDPASWEKRGRDPLDYLRAMQQADGEILWKEGPAAGTNSIWMTAYAAPAFAGMTWPLAFVPRAVKPDPARPADPPSGAGDTGGTARDGDGRVIAGGGGNGAPLFSRPQPQSRGSTPGGVRRTRTRRAEKRGRERDHRPATMPRQESTSPPTEPRAPGRPTARAPGGPRGHRWRRWPGGRPGRPRRANRPSGRRRPPLGPLAGGWRRRPPRETPSPRRAKDRPRLPVRSTPARPAPMRRARRTACRSKDAWSRTRAWPVRARARSSRPRPAFAPPGPATGLGRAVALGIGGGLVLIAAVGVAFERRRPPLASPTAPSGASVIGGAT